MKWMTAALHSKVGRITYFHFLLIGLIFAKVTLSAVTVSPDTEAYALQLMSESIVIRSTPWGLVNWIMYQFWLNLPIDRTDLLSDPQRLRMLTPSSASLFLVLKLPAFALDALTGIALYMYRKSLGSSKAAWRVLLFWFANPISTLAIEMWGSLMILVTSLFTLSLLTFAQQRTTTSATLGAATFAIAPILALTAPSAWIHLAKNRLWKRLLAQIAFTLIGLAAYVRWTTDLNLDSYRLLSKDTPFSLGVADIQAEPYVFFGANIGLGTSIAFCYLMYSYFAGFQKFPKVLDITYGTLAIITAFSTWGLTFPLLLIPSLCLLMSDNASKERARLGLFVMAILPAWTVLAAAPQLFRAGSSFLFIPVGKGASLAIQNALENATTIFLIRPFLRTVFSTALLVLAFIVSPPYRGARSESHRNDSLASQEDQPS